MEEEEKEPDEYYEEEIQTTVIWEKCIEQTIFVDLSDDESLHFSDLENSFALHFSQAESATSEPSVHLSECVELSDLEESSKEGSPVGNKSMKASESESESSKFHVQILNTMLEPTTIHACEDSEQNTSDEEQEDLPLDDNLRSCRLIRNLDEEHSDHRQIDVLDLPNKLPMDLSIIKNDDLNICNQLVVSPPRFSSGHISHVLLQHFSHNKLLQFDKFIEAETLPDVSLLESVDDTALSLTSTHKSAGVNSDCTKSSSVRSKSSLIKQSLEIKAQNQTDPSTLNGAGDNESCSASSHDSCENISAHEENEEDHQVCRAPLVRARSFSEMKYGQGQVHYPLPDFSKITPKVKIPKVQNEPNGPIPRCPKKMLRVHSSPGMLDVISRVREDSDKPLQSPHVLKDLAKKTSRVQVLQLQSEYDKLLTKYAEMKNSIDDLRLANNVCQRKQLTYANEVKPERDFYSEKAVDGCIEFVKKDELGILALPTVSSVAGNLLQNEDEMIHHKTMREKITVFSKQLENHRTDGERITADLKEVIGQFIQKVQDFKFSVSNMTISTAEQHMMLRSMMEAQDQLERKYLSKKEEHRALEMQNYMGLARNTGTFDSNRQLEGDIFRIGMELEDIKEEIDRNIYEQMSPPNSSSTPIHHAESEHGKAASICSFTPSPINLPHESLHLTEMSSKMKAQEDQINQEDHKTNTENCDNAGSNQSTDLDASDPAIQNKESDICLPRDQLSPPQSPGIQAVDGKEDNREEKSSVLSEVTDESDFLSCLSGNIRFSTEKQDTDSRGSVHNLPEGVSLPVDISSSLDAQNITDTGIPSAPLRPTSCVSREQRIINPETDSGFGSAYLNQTTIQSNPLTTSVYSQSETASCSDSEASCSNLPTAIPSAAPRDHQKTSFYHQIHHHEPAVAVEHWLEKSTTKKTATRRKGSRQNLPTPQHHKVPDPAVPSFAMDATGRSSSLNPCSCNSDVILALQSDVSRLQKELKTGLVQLPHLAQKMDYLTSKYTQEGQEYRPKSRSTQTPEMRNVKKSSGKEEMRHSSSQQELEDWISSDMDQSKGKGTDSGDTSFSENVLHDSFRGSKRDKQTSCAMSETEDILQLKTERNKRTSDTDSTLKKETRLLNKGTQASDGSFHSKNRRTPPSDFSHPKPLLQVNYSSSSSLPASYKMKEPHLQTTPHRRKHSTQSDTAILPSNVYFMQTPSPHPVSPTTASKTGRCRRKKEDDIKRTLDQAIRVALKMKRTTDCMARKLSADLAKAQQNRKLYNMPPLGSRIHKPL